jgi:hypothetical protein
MVAFNVKTKYKIEILDMRAGVDFLLYNAPEFGIINGLWTMESTDGIILVNCNQAKQSMNVANGGNSSGGYLHTWKVLNLELIGQLLTDGAFATGLVVKYYIDTGGGSGYVQEWSGILQGFPSSNDLTADFKAIESLKANFDTIGTKEVPRTVGQLSNAKASYIRTVGEPAQIIPGKDVFLPSFIGDSPVESSADDTLQIVEYFPPGKTSAEVQAILAQLDALEAEGFSLVLKILTGPDAGNSYAVTRTSELGIFDGTAALWITISATGLSDQDQREDPVICSVLAQKLYLSYAKDYSRLRTGVSRGLSPRKIETDGGYTFISNFDPSTKTPGNPEEEGSTGVYILDVQGEKSARSESSEDVVATYRRIASYVVGNVLWYKLALDPASFKTIFDKATRYDESYLLPPSFTITKFSNDALGSFNPVIGYDGAINYTVTGNITGLSALSVSVDLVKSGQIKKAAFSFVEYEEGGINYRDLTVSFPNWREELKRYTFDGKSEVGSFYDSIGMELRLGFVGPANVAELLTNFGIPSGEYASSNAFEVVDVNTLAVGCYGENYLTLAETESGKFKTPGETVKFYLVDLMGFPPSRIDQVSFDKADADFGRFPGVTIRNPARQLVTVDAIKELNALLYTHHLALIEGKDGVFILRNWLSDSLVFGGGTTPTVNLTADNWGENEPEIKRTNTSKIASGATVRFDYSEAEGKFLNEITVKNTSASEFEYNRDFIDGVFDDPNNNETLCREVWQMARPGYLRTRREAQTEIELKWLHADFGSVTEALTWLRNQLSLINREKETVVLPPFPLSDFYLGIGLMDFIGVKGDFTGDLQRRGWVIDRTIDYKTQTIIFKLFLDVSALDPYLEQINIIQNTADNTLPVIQNTNNPADDVIQNSDGRN